MPAASHDTSAHSASLVSDDSRQALLDWFHAAREKRAMPWRRLPPTGMDRAAYRKSLEKAGRGQWAYEVLVVEVMLQQTQVATVIPYFQRWMLKYPTIQDLAQGTQEEVHALWAGLGYYSRATRLLLAAQKVVKDYDGNLPSDPKDLEKNIPGVGPYTAGAVSSIVYGRSVPLVDGNVQRVLSRLLGIYADPKGKAFSVAMWSLAAELVEKVEDGMGGDWNEGLMELGATVCKPTEADCGSCPLSSSCVAFKESTAHSTPTKPAEVDIEDLCTMCVPVPAEEKLKGVLAYPLKAVKKKPREEHVWLTVLEWRTEDAESEEGLFLVIKRPETGLLAGLFEFPSTSCDPEPVVKEATSTKQLKTFLPTPLPPTTLFRTFGTVFHQFSHISMTYHVQHLSLLGSASRPPPKVDRGRWVTRAMLEGQSGDGKGDDVEVNMGTGGKKCWTLVWKGNDKKTKGSTAAKSKGMKVVKDEVGQSKISSFFKDPPKRKALEPADATQDIKEAVDLKPVKQSKVKSAVVKKRKIVLVSDDEDDVEVAP